MATALKPTSKAQLKEATPEQKKAIVLQFAPKLVDLYAQTNEEVKDARKKRLRLKLWMRLAKKRRLDSKTHYVKISTEDVIEVDFKKLKKLVGRATLQKCSTTKQVTSVRVFSKNGKV